MHINDLINQLQDRQRALGLKAARYGINVPPEVVIESEYIGKAIDQLMDIYGDYIEFGTIDPTKAYRTQTYLQNYLGVSVTINYAMF